jgi:eukaryotic-like serine/threonine-protein kinase
MNQLREHWEGVSLPGDYLLERWLSGDDAAGFFETSLASDGSRAVVRLVRESEVDSDAQLALWQRTRQLRHPNLRELLDCGRAELSGDVVLYAVFEHADDTLAAALSLSPLSEPEAREVLEAVHGALSYLQGQGLAHAALDPDHVVAVGDRIKLSSDLLRQVEAGAPYIDELRVFWYKISPCTMARSADIFAQVLGLESRAGTRATPGPASVEIPPTADDAARPALELSPPEPHRFPKWVLVGAAGVVLLILGLNLRRDPEAAAPPPAVSTPRPAPIAAAVPPVPKSSPVTETIPKTLHQPAAQPATAGKAMWRVIAFAYRTRAGATKKAEQVNRRHPDLEARVFSPKERKGYYLVSLGGRMTRDDALRRQKKARAEGLARDVYVQNYLD